jgi:hypothetical protein
VAQWVAQDVWELFSSKGILALYHSGGCTCCYQYVEHLLDTEEWDSLTQSNVDIEAAVTKAWPELVNQLRQDGMDSVSAELRELKDKLAHQNQRQPALRSHTATSTSTTALWRTKSNNFVRNWSELPTQFPLHRWGSQLPSTSLQQWRE